jgi:hypothetical protein
MLHVDYTEPDHQTKKEREREGKLTLHSQFYKRACTSKSVSANPSRRKNRHSVGLPAVGKRRSS